MVHPQLRVVVHIAGDEQEALHIRNDVTLDCMIIDTTISPSLSEVHLFVTGIIIALPFIYTPPLMAHDIVLGRTPTRATRCTSISRSSLGNFLPTQMKCLLETLVLGKMQVAATVENLRAVSRPVPFFALSDSDDFDR
jgi:hypothetical protein